MAIVSKFFDQICLPFLVFANTNISTDFKSRLVERMTTMTYQAAFGAGAAKMLELVRQMEGVTEPTRATPSENALELDRRMIQAQRAASLPIEEIGALLRGSLIPWIDRDMPGGQTREEWKGMAETNKIMGLEPPIPVDGVCVRVGTMRCYSLAKLGARGQAVCIKLSTGGGPDAQSRCRRSRKPCEPDGRAAVPSLDPRDGQRPPFHFWLRSDRRVWHGGRPERPDRPRPPVACIRAQFSSADPGCGGKDLDFRERA